MIALNNKLINKIIKNSIPVIGDKINTIKQDINEITNFSSMLEVDKNVLEQEGLVNICFFAIKYIISYVLFC